TMLRRREIRNLNTDKSQTRDAKIAQFVSIAPNVGLILTRGDVLMLRFKSTANLCVVYLITLVSLSLPHLLFAMPAMPGDIAVRAFPRGGSLADFATLKFTAQDYTMSRKSTAPARKAAGAGFHLEQLEPRCMFAADGFLPEPRGESFLDGDGLPAISLHDIPPL